MIMTVIVASAIIFTSLWITLELNDGFNVCKAIFGVYIGRNETLLINADKETKAIFCNDFITSLQSQQAAS